MDRTEFTVIIERDCDSGWLVGSVIELPGCYSQASSLAELEANMGEAIALYLASVDSERLPRATFIGLLRIGVANGRA